MSSAAARPLPPVTALPPPDSYETRARLLLVRSPDLFVPPARSGNSVVVRRGPQVQPARAGRSGRRGGRQLALPLASGPGMLR